MTLQNLYGIIALVVCVAGEGYILWTIIRRAIQKRQARPRPTLWYAAWGGKLRYYAYVGDPKHEAKVLHKLVKMLSAKKDNQQ